MSTARRLRTQASLIALFSIGALALAGCTSGDDNAAPQSKNGASLVKITLTGGDKDQCTLDYTTVPAGPVTFTVENKNSTAITEVELQSQNRILGEKENLAPGLAPVKLTLTLDGGDYQVSCPGAAKPMQKLTVTGKASAAPSGGVQALLAQGTTGYASYTKGVVDDMVTAVTNLQTAVDSGNVDKAKKQYALARPFYEKIESDVDGFVLPGFKADDNAGNLDYLIDMRESTPVDPKVGWSGQHAIERDLFQNGAITDQTKKYAADLVSNTQKLQQVMSSLSYKPEDLANGAADLLEEVQATKITGEEEAYSHIDLLDFAANVEGAQQAFAYLRPGLDKIDSALATQIATQFDKVNALLEKYRDPDALGGYKQWVDPLKSSDAPTLSRAVQALQEPLATIAEKVATAH